MIRLCISICILCSLFYVQTLAQQEKSVFIELRSDAKERLDTFLLTYQPVEILPKESSTIIKKPGVSARWSFKIRQPIVLGIQSVKPLNNFSWWYLEPGDSVSVNYSGKNLFFTGRGSEKLNFACKLYSLVTTIKRPFNPSLYTVTSIDDYLEWNSYLNKQWALAEPLIEANKDKLSEKAYQYLKVSFINKLEGQRLSKFNSLCGKFEKEGATIELDSSDLSRIYDSTFFKPWAKWMRSQPMGLVSNLGYRGFVKHQILRFYNYSPSWTVLTMNSINRRRLYLEQGKKEYQGLALEYFLAQLLTDEIIEEIGFLPETEDMLTQYYSEKRHPKYQGFVREFEKKARILKDRQDIPNFFAFDQHGKVYSKESLKGKITILYLTALDDFENYQKMKSLKKIEEIFNKDSGLQFIYITKNRINHGGSQSLLNTSKVSEKSIIYTAFDNLVFKKYSAIDSSVIYIVGQDGKIAVAKTPDPRTQSSDLIRLIKQQLELSKKESWISNNDGPYVLTSGDSIKTYSIVDGKLYSADYYKEAPRHIRVHTDVPGKTFKVYLKETNSTEPSIFEKPSKVLAFSDIEGNFEALRLLLENNKVIDKDYNWIFGNGHVVFAGDMFDRGNQVTECLWLIYSLEQKAKAAGGYVHFILGNHEIMNLSGDGRYIHSKYKENSRKMGKQCSELYGANSELGAWLRTKNIIEQIGDMLFLHGGLSKEVFDLSLTIEKINETARPYYDKEVVARTSENHDLSLLFNTLLSPFWYRQYYQETDFKVVIAGNRLDTLYKTPKSVIDSILERYKINKIVTGHTVFDEGGNSPDYGKHITLHYNDRVINMDTRHAKGYSEALMVIANEYFRTNKNGERWPLAKPASQLIRLSSN